MIDEELKEVEVTLDEEKEEESQNQNPIEEAVNEKQLDTEGDSSEDSGQEKPELESELSTLKSEIEEIKKEPYSERVKKRIAKEVAKTRAATEKAKLLEERLSKIETSIEEKEKEEKEATYKTVSQKLKDAIEAGETDKQVELMEAMSDLRQSNISEKTQAKEQPASTEPPELAKEWIAQNKGWWNKAGHMDATSLALGIDNELTSEGYDVNEVDYYEELNKRMAKFFPDLINPQETADKNTSQDDKKTISSEQKRVQSPVAGVSRSTSGSAKSVKLSSDDLVNAKKFGIDISDPAALKRYAREIASLSTQDNSKGA
jgi:hypothetical protein